MTEYNKMRLTKFYCYYMIAVTIFSSLFRWFQGDLTSWLRLLLILVVPLPIVWRNERGKEEKMPGCHQEFLGAGGLLALPGTFDWDGDLHVIVCCLFFVASIILCYVNQYLQKRYTVLYCNPSVSEETRKRANRLQRRPLITMSAIAGGVLILLMLIMMLMPEIDYKPSERTDQERQEQDNMVERAPEERTNEVLEKIREEQEEASDNFWLMLLRYIITYAIIVMVALAVAYAMFRFIIFLMNRRRKVAYEFEERIEEESNLEEITRLQPVVKAQVKFPSGRDGQIRRAFYKSVRRGAGARSVDRALTPEELHKEYLRETPRDERLTALYEKARYARESISEEDWEQWEEVNKRS